MFFKFILPSGCSKRFHQFVFPPEVHKNVKFSTLSPTMGIINLFKKSLPVRKAKNNISLFSPKQNVAWLHVNPHVDVL